MKNQIKAAYLYSDKVNVYDFSVLNGVSGVRFPQYESRMTKYEIHRNYKSIVPHWLDGIESLDDLHDYLGSKDTYDWFIEKVLPWYFENYGADGNISKLSNLFEYYSPLDSSTLSPEESLIQLEKCFLESNAFHMLNGNLLTTKSSDLAFSKGINFANYLFTNLPTFDRAEPDELIDIKKELDKYIVNFRSAIIDLSSSIDSLPNTSDFDIECRNLYFSKVQPQILEIQEAIKDYNIIKNLASYIITSDKTWKGIGSGLSSIMIGLSSKIDTLECISDISVSSTQEIASSILSKLTQAGTLATAGASLAFAGMALSNAVKNSLEKQKNLEKKGLYFYYKVDQRLR